MEYITLNNGIKMPQVGLGTFLIPKDHLENTLIKAYELGYRQFDTAWRYHNENDIANFRQMVSEWRAETDEEVDYNFCYTELLGYFQLDSWNRIPEKKQQRIIEYLIQQV